MGNFNALFALWCFGDELLPVLILLLCTFIVFINLGLVHSCTFMPDMHFSQGQIIKLSGLGILCLFPLPLPPSQDILSGSTQEEPGSQVLVVLILILNGFNFLCGPRRRNILSSPLMWPWIFALMIFKWFLDNESNLDNCENVITAARKSSESLQ